MKNYIFFIHHFNPHPPFTDVNCNLKDPDNYKFDSNLSIITMAIENPLFVQ